MSPPTTQLAILGTGPGGYTAAFLAADLGMKVTLIDRHATPGGTCLHYGCIPSKALLHISRILSESREAAQFGIRFPEPQIDLDRVRCWKNEVVQKLADGLADLCKRRGIERIVGQARFVDSHTVRTELSQGGEDLLAFEHIILATGSVSANIPGLALNSPPIWTSTEGLELQTIPQSLLVVGGGFIGLELSTVYASLGTRVSVVEMTDSLLPGVDRDLVRVLSGRMGLMFEKVMLNALVVGVDIGHIGPIIRIQHKDGTISEDQYEKVLLCTGRKPNTRDLDLQNTSVELDSRGFVKVDTQQRTTDPAILAIGDLTGGPMLAHKAAHEGHIAAEALAGNQTVSKAETIPAVVFTDPEIAWCGLTETEARQAGRNVTVTRFPWGASGRAVTLGRTDGLTKIIIDPETQRILGMGIVGYGAGELIAEGALAIRMGATAADLESVVHPHPTLSETLMESAALFSGRCIHLYRPKK
ncbi:MAG TPA: dihydrolipoyl dehydrogenase [bacterium]|nr:dihydrolipoyl dehydrogenase [bacterium]